MNPLTNVMSRTLKQALEERTQSFLIDSEHMDEYYKEMFVDEEYLPAERSIHTQIPPAKIRIQHF